VPGQTKDKLIESANTYLSLGKLLKKKRSRWAKQEVQKVLALNISDGEKVIEIRKIDQIALSRIKLLDKEKQAGTSKPHKVETPPVESPPAKLKKVSFLSYLLFEYRKIARFGKKTRTLKGRFPYKPFTFREEVDDSLFEIQNLTRELLDPLNYLIEKGWASFNKEEYNVLSAFYSFCDKYYKEYLQDFSLEDLKYVEEDFLAVVQKDRYKDMLYDLVRKGLEDHSLYSKRLDGIIRNIQRIIEPDLMCPSMTDIVLALEMRELKRFCRLMDLVFSRPPYPIRRNQYQASDKVMAEIRKYVWQKEQELASGRGECEFLAFVAERLIPDWRNPGFALIKRLSPNPVDEADREEDSPEWRDEIPDLAEFAILLLKEYNKVFLAFATDKVSLITADGSIIAERIVPFKVESHFLTIQENYRMLTELLKRGEIKKVSFKGYESWVNHGDPIPDEESALYLILKTISDNFYDISRKMHENYVHEKEIGAMPVNERLNHVKDKNIFEETIPYSRGRINLNYLLSNKTVLEAYLELMRFAVSFSYFFLNERLMTRLELVPSLRKEIISLKQLIQRMK